MYHLYNPLRTPHSYKDAHLLPYSVSIYKAYVLILGHLHLRLGQRDLRLPVFIACAIFLPAFSQILSIFFPLADNALDISDLEAPLFLTLGPTPLPGL